MVEHLLQQKGSKLRGAVAQGGYSGEGARYIEQVGKVDRAAKNMARLSDTPIMDVPATNRWIYPNTFDWATLIDSKDRLFMLIDPTGPYAEAAAFEMGRQIDNEIVRGMFDVARTGKNAGTAVAFPSTNIVDKDVGGAGSGMNVAKLRAAKKILLKNQVDINEQMFCAITAEQWDNLMADAQTVSLDYNTRPVLVDGNITSFMGVNFIPIELSGLDDGDTWTLDSEGNRLCPLWVKSGVHFGTWRDISTKIEPRPDKRYATQIYTEGVFGATRTQEGKVVAIACVEP
jgi:hypothetical protein